MVNIAHTNSNSAVTSSITPTNAEAEEPAIGGYSHQEHYPPHLQEQDAALSLSLTERLRGRLLDSDPTANAGPTSQLRSASAPNLRSDKTIGSDAQVTAVDTIQPGLFKRTTTGLSGSAQQPPARPPLIAKILEPTKPVGKPPGWKASFMSTLRYSWLNVLLIMIPIAWAMEFSHQAPTVVFVCSAVAIVPLAALLGHATEELALRVGDALGGLLNSTFGNAVELIISILALVKGELRIVQSSMLGSILSNTLLVLGMAYFAGGIRFHEQGYAVRAAQVNINLLGIAVAAIIIPVGYHTFVADLGTQSLATTDADVLGLSRGIAFILLVVYGAYLLFQLRTHSYLYLPPPLESGQVPVRGPSAPFIEGPQPPTEGGVFRIPSLPSWGGSSSTSSSAGSVRGRSNSVGEGEEGMARDGDEAEKGAAAEEKKRLKEEEEHTPKLSVWFALTLLLVVTVITGVTAEFLISSIDGLTASGNISREFVALILLPLVGNAAEHVTAVTVAAKDKLNLSMAIAVGSSLQIALFVIPLLVLLGWAIGQPLTLYFDPFETLVLFISVVAVNWAIADGRTNWLEGFTLMIIYVIIAVTFFYYPGLPEAL